MFKTKQQHAAQIDNNSALEDAAVLAAFSRSQAVIEFTPTGEILTANENFCSALGYALQEIVGKHHSIFVSSQEASSSEYRQFWRDLAGGSFFSGEFQRTTKSGDKIWIAASYNAVLDESGNVTKVVKIASDITDTKRETIERKALIDSISRSQAVIEFGLDGTIRSANNNFLNTLGYNLDEIQGKHHRMFCDPEYTESADYNAFWEQLRRGEFVAKRFRRIAKGGREVWIQASYNPVYDDSGVLARIVKLAFDITAEVQAERQTQETSRAVGQSVAATTTEMSATIDEIAKNVARTASLSQDAESHAVTCSKSTESLQQSSAAIGKVVSMIQELADQTNLLALNATIEAARAGEHGRSFAVVASEVKALANETSTATGSIEKSVQEIQDRILSVTDSARLIGDSITQVSQNTNSIASAIEEQSITMSELSQTAEKLCQ